MRGKKTDPAFVAQFIQESVQEGIETPAEIVKYAKQKIANIDEEIRALELKKIIRSKLLDVIVAFESPVKNKSEDAKFLPFFNLQYPERCKELCKLIKNNTNSISIDNWGNLLPDEATTIFCKKQLLEQKIIDRKQDDLVRGERFEEYMRFVLHEDQ